MWLIQWQTSILCTFTFIMHPMCNTFYLPSLLFLSCPRRLVVKLLLFFYFISPRVWKNMGGQISNRMGNKAEGRKAKSKEQLKYAVEFRGYDELCKTDLDVKRFNDALQTRKGQVINALANDSLSLYFLKEVTSCFLDMNQNVATLILGKKKDIWNTPDLPMLVEQYFGNSIEALNFYTMLENCLRRARENLLTIENGLKLITPEAPPPGEAQYSKILEELRNFRTAGNPFADEFDQHFKAVHGRHVEMLDKLSAENEKLDEKRKNARVWRKFLGIIFVATGATLFICSVVAMVITAQPFPAFIAAASISIGAIGPLVNLRGTKFEDTIKGQIKVLKAMEAGSFAEQMGLDSIKVLVGRLERSISSILRSEDLCVENEDAVQIIIEDMRRKQKNLMDDIDYLFALVVQSGLDIQEAMTSVQDKIVHFLGI